MELIKLDTYFVGGGTKKGMIFNQIRACSGAYLYEINNFGTIHYEIFKRRQNAICVDFEKRLYSSDVFKETYPKDENFGAWAWTTLNKEKAIFIFKNIDNGRQ